MFERDDDLLYILSAWQEMNWPSFRKSIDALHARLSAAENTSSVSHSHLRWRTLRLLDWLGHCDALAQGRTGRIYVAPTVLARLPVTGLPQAVLCGARAPGTIGILRSACQRYGCRLAIDTQPKDDGVIYIPRRIAIEADSEEAIADIAKDIRVLYSQAPPAWGLLNLCGAVDEYLQSRPHMQAPDLDWPRREFDANTLQFRSPGAMPDRERLSVYEHPLRPESLCYLWSGDTYQEVDRDWGRYALLQRVGVHVLIYDPRRFLLAVPSSTPLPRLLARACSLCSGYAPRLMRGADSLTTSQERIGFYVFCGVPPVAARAIAGKLRQQLHDDVAGFLNGVNR